MSASAGAELHVAAMPFPTRQGTQAVVHAMLEARAAAGVDAQLATYGSKERALATSYPLHRLPALSGRASFASGPSAQKLLLDALLAIQLRRLRRSQPWRVTVAHHVEAAAAALLARARPLVFFAHTDLGPELPTYLPPSLAALRPLARRGGAAIDLAACRGADAVAAISPRLASTLEARSGREVRYVPSPWPVAAPITSDERAAARAALGFSGTDEVLLYAGNLDGYQGLPLLLRAFARALGDRPATRLLVATASPAADFEARATRAGVGGALHVVDLPHDEAGRRQLHAAADLAVIPRAAAGGLPMKLLDALGRGLPTLAARRAAAGIPIDDAALLVADDDAEAMANGITTLLTSKPRRAALGAAARAYISTEHSAQRFDAAMDERIGTARSVLSLAESG